MPSDSENRSAASARASGQWGFVVEHLVLAMQAAWIEWKYGDGAERAMLWIENTLDGPDSIPDVAAVGTDAQAFFDKAINESRARQTAWLAKLDEAHRDA